VAGKKETAGVDIYINTPNAKASLRDLTGEVKKLRSELNRLPADTKEFNDKAKELKQAEDRLGEVRNKAKAAGNGFKEMIGNFGPVGQMINGVINGFTSMASGAKSFVSGMGLVKTAVAATGIGFLVLAVIALVEWFKKTDTGAKTLEGIMNSLGNVVNILSKYVIAFGKNIYEAIQNPRQLLEDFSNFLVNNVANRFKSFAVIWDGIRNGDMKKVNDGAIQLGTGIEGATDKAKRLANAAGDIYNEFADAVKAGFELAELMDTIDEETRNINEANSENEKTITRLLLQSKNKSLADQDRLSLLEKASKLEAENLKNTLYLEELKLKAINAEIAQKAKIDGMNEVSDDLLNKRSEAIVQRNKLEQDSLNLQEKITNRKAALELEIQADKKKTQEATEKALKDAYEVEKSIENMRLRLISDGFEREKALLNADYEDKINNLKGNEAQILEQKKLLAELENQELTALEQKFKDIREADLEKDLEKQIEGLELAKELTDASIEDNLNRGILQEQQVEAAKLVNQEAFLNAKLALLKKAGLQESSEAKKIGTELLKINSEKNRLQIEDDRRTAQAKAQMISSFGQLTTSIMQLNAANGNEHTEFQKGLALASIAINTAQAIGTTIAGASAAAAAGGPAAPFLLVGYIAAGIATVISSFTQASQLLSQAQAPQQPQFQAAPTATGFAEGGYTGSGGKYEPAGIVHKGEYVIPSYILSNPRFGPNIAALESARTKKIKGFADGGLVNDAPNINIELTNSILLEILAETQGTKEAIQDMEVQLSLNALEKALNNKSKTLKDVGIT
jgi:hypothetical protein